MIFLETIYCIILILMKGISVKCVIVIFVGMKSSDLIGNPFLCFRINTNSIIENATQRLFETTSFV